MTHAPETLFAAQRVVRGPHAHGAPATPIAALRTGRWPAGGSDARAARETYTSAAKRLHRCS